MLTGLLVQHFRTTSTRTAEANFEGVTGATFGETVEKGERAGSDTRRLGDDPGNGVATQRGSNTTALEMERMT